MRDSIVRSAVCAWCPLGRLVADLFNQCAGCPRLGVWTVRRVRDARFIIPDMDWYAQE
ncbi:MAG: hypothetical protein RLN78_05190 [Phycisphaerales bacterium]